MPTDTPPDGRVPTHQRIARHLRNDIEAGVLRDREVLPSTRALAAKWGTSVFTVNQAMKALIDEGLVVSRSRSMRVVNKPDAALTRPLRTNAPQVILIGGYPGSGKSESGRILARATGWPIIDKDTTTRPVVEAALEVHGLPPHDRESPTYLAHVRPREYEALMATAAENAECAVSVVVTAPFFLEFSAAAWLDRETARFEALGANVTLVWMNCDAESMHAHIRRRGAARDTVKLADWPAYVAASDLASRPVRPHIVIENSASSEPLQSQARTLLSALGDTSAP
ncbi:MAG: GntR family transcriptional regulator [Phycicoccus sp.]